MPRKPPKKKSKLPDSWAVLHGSRIGNNNKEIYGFEYQKKFQVLQGAGTLRELCLVSGLVTEEAWKEWHSLREYLNNHVTQ